MSTENLFLQDVTAMRLSARDFLAQGVSRDAAGQDTCATIKLLQAALSVEIVCVWRYTMMSVSARGLSDEQVGFEFQEQSNDERRHARMVAERIEQLGGTPNFQPEGLTSRLTMEYGTDADLDSMIAQNLAAEQAVIAYYNDLIRHFQDTDPQTTAMFERILLDEENHATDMQDLLGP